MSAESAARDGEQGRPDHLSIDPSSDGEVQPTAEISKRLIAGVIDAVIAVVIGLVPLVGGFAAAGYWLVRDGLELDFMNRRSVGKQLMKLRPVRLDGSPMDITASAKRNWMFALGGVVQILLWIPLVGWLLIIPVGLAAFGIGVIELFLVLTDSERRRLGDKIADTKVVEVGA